MTAVSIHGHSSLIAAVSDDMLSALIRYKHFLQVGCPRVFKPSSTVPLFIQTNACYEVDDRKVTADVGAVLFGAYGRAVFSHQRSDLAVGNLNPSTRREKKQFLNVNSLRCVVPFGYGALKGQMQL